MPFSTTQGTPYMELTGKEDHHISLDAASAMTAAYRVSAEGKAGRAILGGVFGRGIIDEILAQPGCVGIRYYYGLDKSSVQVLMLVGVTADNNDIWQGTIAEVSFPCPPACPMPNPLNR